jgi:molybdopterin converting factor small subunit
VITVKLPSTLSVNASDTLEVRDPVPTLAALIEVLDRRIPGFRDQLDDSVFNFAVNDEMLLHRVREHALRDGDVVEVVPTISGGDGRWVEGVTRPRSGRGASEDQARPANSAARGLWGMRPGLRVIRPAAQTSTATMATAKSTATSRSALLEKLIS